MTLRGKGNLMLLDLTLRDLSLTAVSTLMMTKTAPRQRSSSSVQCTTFWIASLRSQ
jgi:hypothetical protein